MNRPRRRRRRPSPSSPSSPFVGHVLEVVRLVPYRPPGWEEWSEDGGLIYGCVAHVGDLLHLMPVDDKNSGDPCWINLSTVAEIRLACDCDAAAPEDDGPPIEFTVGDPSRN
jgi:hypothetical protein